AHFAGRGYRHGEACSERRSIWSRQAATVGGRSARAALADMFAALRRNGCRTANHLLGHTSICSRGGEHLVFWKFGACLAAAQASAIGKSGPSSLGVPS